MKTLDLFRNLGDEELELVSLLFRQEAFKKGETLFRDREPGGKIFVVDCGVVELWKTGGAEGRPARVALVERGEILGELSLADDGARGVNATAAVTPETKVYAADVPAFQALLAQHPALANKILRNLLRRLGARLRVATETLRGLVCTLDVP